MSQFLFFFNDTATTEIYTLSLHDALPISNAAIYGGPFFPAFRGDLFMGDCNTMTFHRLHLVPPNYDTRSEEHTSELQSQSNLVCRLLLEKKKFRRIHALRPASWHDRPARS